MIRLLGPSEYGLYNTVASTISMLSLLSLGFNAGYVRYYTKYKKEGDQESIKKLNGLFVLIFTIMGLIALICGLFLSCHLEFVFNDGLTNTELNIAKVLMILLSINMAESFPASVFTTIISANERFVFLKVLGMMKTVVGPIVTLPFLLLGFRSITMVSVTVLISIVNDIIYTYYVLCILKNKFRFSGLEKKIFIELFTYTGFIAINMIVDQVNWNIDKILLGRFKGTTSVAVYAVGYSLFNYYMMLSTSVSSVFTPRIHAIVVECEENKIFLKDRLTSLFIKVGRIQFLILALVVSGFVLFGLEFIKIWVGIGYEEAFYVALLLILSGLIPLIQNIGIEMQRAQNLHQFRSVVYLIMAMINFGLSLSLCQIYGVIGCAIGTAISLVTANGVVMNIYYYKKCNLDIILFWRNIGKMMIGIIPPIIVGFLWNKFAEIAGIWKMILGILLYSFVYLLSTYFISMNSNEKKYVNSLFHKLEVIE